MTTLTAPPRTSRLLSGWRSTHSTDLGAHVSVHGPLPLPFRGDTTWRQTHASEIRASGLRGRGGAGFEAWRKLDSVRAARGVPTVVVNAMEGEPGSAKDRVLLECAPHLVLDGAQLTAIAIGAERVIVCVADTERRAAESVLRSIGERQAFGLDPVAVEVARPPGGFVAGEESALASWLDRPARLTDTACGEIRASSSRAKGPLSSTTPRRSLTSLLSPAMAHAGSANSEPLKHREPLS